MQRYPCDMPAELFTKEVCILNNDNDDYERVAIEANRVPYTFMMEKNELMLEDIHALVRKFPCAFFTGDVFHCRGSFLHEWKLKDSVQAHVPDIAAYLMKNYTSAEYAELTVWNNAKLCVHLQMKEMRTIWDTPAVYIESIEQKYTLTAKGPIQPNTEIFCTRGWAYWTSERWHEMQLRIGYEQRCKFRREYGLPITEIVTPVQRQSLVSMKTCRVCKEHKSKPAYSKSQWKKGGTTPLCLACNT